MDSILRTKDVLNVVGFARTTLWRRVKSGDFPQPVRLGGAGSRAVGWRSGEVERWLAERQSVSVGEGMGPVQVPNEYEYEY